MKSTAQLKTEIERLQKSVEKQALELESKNRELEIEAALERVRSRTIAMQQSSELNEVSVLLYKELMKLGISDFFNCGYVELHEKEEVQYAWVTRDDGTFLGKLELPLTGDKVLNERYEAWKIQKPLFSQVLNFNQLKSHLAFISPQHKNKEADDVVKRFPNPTIFYNANFKHGYLHMNTGKYLDDEGESILIRFTQVFAQTYTRFLDLKKAEAQAREAQIEGALEKVRSRTLAMQSSEELAETAAVLFSQLIALGVDHERINIGIVSEENQNVEFWSTEQGGNIIKTRFEASIHEPTVINKLYQAWKQEKETLTVDLKGQELQSWVSYCENVIGIPFDKNLLQDQRVQSAAFFSKGMLMLTTPTLAPSSTIALLVRFASVFNLTFTRFNDLKIAEANARRAEKDLILLKEAKVKAELAFTELKSTQAQLIQSEKMASLGELTAGIAHEIQNPLNFVNNFSEVSAELVEEIKETRIKNQETRPKTTEDEIEDEILEDIKQNLEKITLHGKRADAIVKGMLEHSRANKGEKAPTDLNALADEFLRLSYHGLRAKDKSFNSDFKLDLDPDLPKVDVVASDIGRVILNLVNNAFYAVHEKAKSSPDSNLDEGFQPEVIVSSKKTEKGVELSVQDNGSGIPDSIKDKIFQPFFTTKPTGSGTGLGLSLTYDIVKTHGGELRVESMAGGGTTFFIYLPLN